MSILSPFKAEDVEISYCPKYFIKAKSYDKMKQIKITRLHVAFYRQQLVFKWPVCFVLFPVPKSEVNFFPKVCV